MASNTEPAASASSQDRLEKESLLLRSEIKSWWVLRVMQPVETFCLRHDVRPNTITLSGLGVATICATLFATGHILTAGWMVWIGGSLDFVDGRVARATNRVTTQGAFLDSVVDRYQDFLLFAGLAIFFRHSSVLYLVLLALGGTMFVPYARSKAAESGVSLEDVGVMQRPERIFILGAGAIAGSVLQISLMPFYGKGNPPPFHLLILGIAGMAIGTNLTAIRRIRYTMKALENR